MDDFVLLHPRENRFSDLHLCFCGYEECVPLHSFGPAVRPNYIIHCILEGEGVFQAKNRSWHLGPGDGFLIEPKVQTFYQADVKKPWKYVWIGFEGRIVDGLLREMGLGGESLTFHTHEPMQLRDIVFQMLQHYQFSAKNELMLESRLYQFFAVLMGDFYKKSNEQAGSDNRYVFGAIEYIRNNYSEHVTVADLARFVGIHRSYLSTLFKKETGVSPQQYLANFRLTMAAEMLSSTRYPIETVALSCGYQDPLVFSKAFKQKYNITPVKYRQKALQESSEKLEAGLGVLQGEIGRKTDE